jgi:PilZ domain
MGGMTDWLDNDDPGYRRRFSRRPVRLSTRLRIGDTEIEAETENISPGGAFLRVSLPETAQRVVASIELPHGRNLHVLAKVCWRRPGEPPGVGIEFETFLQHEGEPEAILP